MQFELRNLRRILPPQDYRRYLLRLAKAAPKVLAERNLGPVDRRMTETIEFVMDDARIAIPVGQVQDAIEPDDVTPTFGLAREMFGRNVYLRAFQKDMKAERVVDLGSNRGFFLVQARQMLGARRGIGVEASSLYVPAFDALSAANGMTADAFFRVYKFASATSGPDTITMPEVLDLLGPGRVNFMKCDIEGGEYDVFGGDTSFLDHVDNAAFELHDGDNAMVQKAFTDRGYETLATCNFGRTVPVGEATFLYASCTGMLVPPSGDASGAAT